MSLWIFGATIAIALAAFIALRWAIAVNAPAVLDNVDRITGGARGVELVQTAQYGDASAQKVRIYGPDKGEAELRPVIIFQHGGSWNSGDPDDYGFVARALVPEGFVVVLAGYRMHPDAIFPAMLEDTASAIAWTKANIAESGGDPERIILAGHSAGAYNVVMTALDQQWLEKVGLDDNAIAGVIGLAGPYDFYPFDSDSTKASFGSVDTPESTQPINSVRGDAPAMLFIHGENDTTVRSRNSRVLAASILSAGGNAKTEFFSEMDHKAPLMALASPYRRDSEVLDLVAEFALAARPSAQTSVPVQGETR